MRQLAMVNLGGGLVGVVGLLIHAAVGRAGGRGARRTKRSGVVA